MMKLSVWSDKQVFMVSNYRDFSPPHPLHIPPSSHVVIKSPQIWIILKIREILVVWCKLIVLCVAWQQAGSVDFLQGKLEQV
jgi:hypothetical protein